MHFSVNHFRDRGVCGRRPATLPPGPHVQKGRNEGSRQDSPEEVRRSCQGSVFTPYPQWMGSNGVVQPQKGTWISGSRITTARSTRLRSISTCLWINLIWRLSLSWMGSRGTKSTSRFVHAQSCVTRAHRGGPRSDTILRTFAPTPQSPHTAEGR